MIGSNGLLVAFDWLIDGPWWLVFLKCALFTPLALIIIAPILESRWLPLHWRRQFLTFTIGDIALAVFVATIVSYIRESSFMQIDLWLHLAVLASCLFVAWFMTHGEWKSALAGAEAAYAPRAVRSPTKLYHNYALYGGYAYVMAMLFAEVVLQGRFLSWSTTLVFLPFLIWLAILLLEGILTSKEVAVSRAHNAHVRDWQPLWYWIV